jgi:putative peptidoglycan lipid II flippase
MGLALASALASYLNLAQLWIGLRRDGIHVGQPGWTAHLVRLGVSCVAMVGVIVACLAMWPDWSAWDTTTRIWKLAVVMGAAGGAFVVVLFACGFRLSDLKAH